MSYAAVGWYIHVCMFLIFIDFVRCCIPVPSLIKDFIIIIIIIIIVLIYFSLRDQWRLDPEHT